MIDFFNKRTSFQVEHLKMLLSTRPGSSPIIILPVIMQKVLQGIENDRLFITVKENLQGLDIIIGYEPYETAIKAA